MPYTYIYSYLYISIYTYTRTPIPVYMYIRTCIYLYAYTYIPIRIHAYTYIHAHPYVYLSLHAYTYIRIYIPIYILELVYAAACYLYSSSCRGCTVAAQSYCFFTGPKLLRSVYTLYRNFTAQSKQYFLTTCYTTNSASPILLLSSYRVYVYDSSTLQFFAAGM
jgi:hypothetical protein